MQSLSVFLDIAKFDDFRQKMLMSAEASGVSRDLYNCVKFHHCRICVTDFKEGFLFAPAPSLMGPEKAHTI